MHALPWVTIGINCSTLLNTHAQTQAMITISAFCVINTISDTFTNITKHKTLVWYLDNSQKHCFFDVLLKYQETKTKKEDKPKIK